MSASPILTRYSNSRGNPFGCKSRSAESAGQVGSSISCKAIGNLIAETPRQMFRRSPRRGCRRSNRHRWAIRPPQNDEGQKTSPRRMTVVMASGSGRAKLEERSISVQVVAHDQMSSFGDRPRCFSVAALARCVVKEWCRKVAEWPLTATKKVLPYRHGSGNQSHGGVNRMAMLRWNMRCLESSLQPTGEMPQR